MVRTFKKTPLKYLIFNLFVLFLATAFSGQLYAASGEEDNKTAFIGHHISDSHEWHFATLGHTHFTLPLPVILYSPEKGVDVFMSSNFLDGDHNRVPYNGYELDSHDKIQPVEAGINVYDLSITKNVASMLISVVILFAIFLSIANSYKQRKGKAPSGLQSFIEPIILFVRDDIAIPNIGRAKYERFMPFLLTVFFFIWVNNLMGLLPGAANLTGNISVTFVLAVFTFIITNINGNKNYWKHIFATPGVPWWLLPIMIPVELLGVFTKPFSLMVRLFANITAGHIIILSILALIFLFESIAVGPVSVAFATFMNFLELLVAFLQAYVFTLLSAIYFGGAVEEHHHDEPEEAVSKAAA